MTVPRAAGRLTHYGKRGVDSRRLPSQFINLELLLCLLTTNRDPNTRSMCPSSSKNEPYRMK